MSAIRTHRWVLAIRVLLLTLALTPRSGWAQSIGLNQTVIADFNSAAEFQSLSSAGWIFRAGNGVGTQTCASPGNITLCGFGFTQDGASGAARGLAAGNTQGRWIITPPIIFGASGSIRLTLRKAASGTGGIDVRESDGASDTQDMSENEIPADIRTRGSGACPAGNSFCSLRNLRSSGAATSGGEPSCASLFNPGNSGIGIGYCTVEIRASELQTFGTGVHRIAIKLRSASSTAGSNQDVLVDRIEIRTGNNDALPEQAWVSHGFTGSTPPIGLYRHPVNGHTSGNLTLVASQASVDEAAMAFTPDGNTLYAIVGAAPGQLVRIDPLTGGRTAIGTVNGLLSSNEFVRGLMIDPRSGVASLMTRSFADTQSRLYTLDLSNAEANLQAGVNGGGAFRASASAIDCEGRLFSVETSSPGGIGARLYRVDRINGAVTLIGNTGYTSSLFHGPIAFNHRTRQLLGWVQATSGAYVGYGSYNLSTGLYTAISTSPQLTPGAGAINARCWNGFANGFEP